MPCHQQVPRFGLRNEITAGCTLMRELGFDKDTGVAGIPFRHAGIFLTEHVGDQ
jgi:hypothetical protein